MNCHCGGEGQRARRQEVLLSSPNPVTCVMGMQVNASVLRSTPEALARVLVATASG